MPIAGKPSKQVEIEIKRVITHSDLPTADQVPDNRLYGKDKDNDHLQVGAAGSSRPRSGQPWPYSLGVAKTDVNTNVANTKTTSSGMGAYRDDGFEDDDQPDEELHVQPSTAARHSSGPPFHAQSNGVDKSRPFSGPGQSQAGGGQKRWDKSGAARSAVVAQLTEQSMASLLAGGNVGGTNHPSSYDHNAENDLYSYDPNFDDEEWW
jgi:hypothetical protein